VLVLEILSVKNWSMGSSFECGSGLGGSGGKDLWFIPMFGTKTHIFIRARAGTRARGRKVYPFRNKLYLSPPAERNVVIRVKKVEPGDHIVPVRSDLLYRFVKEVAALVV
jgi:hypothetical protein